MANEDPTVRRGQPKWTGSTRSGFLSYLNVAEKERGNRVIKILNLFLDLLHRKKSDLPLNLEGKKTLLEDELSRYRFLPEFIPGRGKGTIQWHIALMRRKPQWSIEGTALGLILELVRTGKLYRFRKCTLCSRWMYARVRHKSFCSQKCQQKSFTLTEKFRLQRNEYMRNYRGSRHDGRSEFGTRRKEGKK